jgi:aldose 1-epimerase
MPDRFQAQVQAQVQAQAQADTQAQSQAQAQIELAAGPARVSIDPASGGRISSLRIDGLELLLPRSDDLLRWGSYPMAPWAGRVRNGRFVFDGKQYALPLGMPPHAIHGTTYTRAWQRVDDAGSASGREATISIDLGPDWPWGGSAVQTFSLQEDHLALRLEVRSGGSPFPASVGWHPWFRREIGRGEAVELDFEPRAMYACDDAGIPTGQLVAPPPGPWDDCFTAVASAPVLRWPGALVLTLESSADHWVVYSQPEHAICVEPMTGPPDVLNSSPAIVTPGTPLVATARFSWRLPGAS